MVALSLTPTQHWSFSIDITREGCGLAVALLAYQTIQINILKDKNKWASAKPSRHMAGLFFYLFVLFFVRLGLELAGFKTNVWIGVQFIIVHHVVEYVGLVQGITGLMQEVTWKRTVKM